MRHGFLALLVAGAALIQVDEVHRFEISPDDYQEHVRVLSADELGGRGNGTPGLHRAAEYIASEFRKAGLETGGDAGSYFQMFDIAEHLGDEATLTVSAGGRDTLFRAGLHYYPLSTPEAGVVGSTPGRVSDPVVFAGYGISAPGLGYDDYAGLNVDGKAVIVLTHEPQENDDRSVFEGRALTPHSDLGRKADLAARRGARLLIVIEDPSHLVDRAVSGAWSTDPQTDTFSIPVVRADRARLDRLLVDLDLDRVARDIDVSLSPRSRDLPGITILYTAPLIPLNPLVQNVVGVLKGADRLLASEAIVIGAHYDHLGLGGRFSREQETFGHVHNGADDNASGTAIVIEMARAAVRQRALFKRSIVFVTFAGEELGLLGSRHYVRRAPITIKRTVGMVNLDMVGRANGRVMIGGTLRNSQLRQLLDPVKPFSALRLDNFKEGYGDGASDNDSFERERVPTLLFFTGFHEDYHKPTDDADRIDAPGAAEIGRLALAMVARMENR